MKVLFVHHYFSHTRHFHSVFRELLARGHSLEVVGLNSLVGQGPTVHPPKHTRHIEPVSYFRLPPPRADFWGGYAEALRASRNVLLYAHPGLRDAATYRERAAALADPFLLRLTPECGVGGRTAWLKRLYRMAEEAMPPDPAVVALLAERRPDVVLVSPLISHEMPMLHEHVKAADMLGIPVGFPVFSWDNLTTKGTLHVMPDRIFVWNDVQRREAIELHEVPPERIDVLGAWRFDEFLVMQPRKSRAAFCEANGFDPAERILLYIGSSPVIAPTEAEFVARWLDAVRSAREVTLRRANILVRPHPRNLAAWQSVSALGPHSRVSIERIEALSLLETQSLYDAIHHSDAVVGLVTSAMIEAALLRKPVHTVLTSLPGAGQGGTVHFRYLTTVGGGLLYVATSLDEHMALLSSHLRAPVGLTDARAENFVRAFVNPPGGSKTSTEALAAAIERLAIIDKAPCRTGWGARAAERLLRLGLRSRLVPIRRKPAGLA